MGHQQSAIRKGFTFVELLVVMSIIVLVIALAVPMFNLITGSRSIDAAANTVSATLGRAHAQALGLQQNVGVAFWVNASSGRTAMAVVSVDPSSSDPRFVDVVADFDLEQLPPGVSAQFVYNCTFNASGQRTSDGYIRQPALIMFDGHGQLISTPYAIRAASRLGGLVGLSSDFNVASARSQFGLVLYESAPFADQGFDDNAFFTSGTYDPAKDTWLDQNAMPYMVNRYNGTLIKAENVK
jgi:prepilin-type N-terminal cleavage/methylation domain-containing protein